MDDKITIEKPFASSSVIKNYRGSLLAPDTIMNLDALWWASEVSHCDSHCDAQHGKESLRVWIERQRVWYLLYLEGLSHVISS